MYMNPSKLFVGFPKAAYGWCAVFLVTFYLFPGAAQGQTPGTGNITFSGSINPPDGGVGFIDLTVNGATTCETLYQPGDLPWDVANRMAGIINAGCTSFVSASVDPHLRGASIVPMVMVAKTNGANTNYAFSIAYRPGDDPFYTLTPSGPTLTGGSDPGQVSVDPKFLVTSIIYSTPGNRSQSGFSNTTTDGTTTSVTDSTTIGNTVTFSAGGEFLGIGSTVSWSYGHANTTGNTSAATSTISQATGVANATNPNAPNAINHHQDLFIIWLNPAVLITQTGDRSGTFSMGTKLQGPGDPSPGQPQAVDQVEVFAESMIANAQGITTVPVEILKPQIFNGQTLPGLANVCANLIGGFPNSCTQANQCGCIPSDFTPILNHNPLLNFSASQSPLEADASGAAACANPSAATNCRYVPVTVAPGSGVQVNETLAGPQQPGGNIPINSFTQTDSNQTTLTENDTVADTVGMTIEHVFKPFVGNFGLRSQTQWTWTHSKSQGVINGRAHTMLVTLASATVACNELIPIFLDTLYHTYVFQQPAGNASCP
jgi:hypothetical protein